MKQLLAILNLGVHFFLHLLRKAVELLTGKTRDPYRQFVEQFRADGLKPLSADDQNALIELQHCSVCGLCQVGLLAGRELRDLSQPIDQIQIPLPDGFKCPFGVDTTRILSLYQRVSQAEQ